MKNTKAWAILAISVLIFSRQSFAVPTACGEGLFKILSENPGKLSLEDSKFLLEHNIKFAEPEVVAAYEKYVAAFENTFFARKFLKAEFVYPIFADLDLPYYSKQLGRLFQAIETLPLRLSSQKKLIAAFEQILNDKVPATSIEKRILGFIKNPSVKTLRRALGQMNVREMALYMHGPNPLKPSADSLVGRYIQETGAQTVVRRFPTKAAHNLVDMSSPLGPERLVVALSDTSAAAYLRYFAREEILVHVHTADQGTLLLMHNARVGNYARMTQVYRSPGLQALQPQILLSTNEGQRLTQYFKLHATGVIDSFIREPWNLQGYCAKGGYDSCTHWFGNMPIGDKLVKSYTFPGRIDQYASNSISKDAALDAAPRTQALAEYNVNQISGFANQEAIEYLINRVWKFPRGHEQLADVIGIGDQNLAGELANPGYVALSLLGAAPQSRVPVVFLSVPNHQLPLDANFALRIRPY